MASSKTQTSSGFEGSWQTVETLAECNLRMLDTEDSCDVTFRCGANSHVVKAHRYMLISRSCVFHAMFSGPLAEKSDVCVPEIEAIFFKELLIYMYTDDVTVDENNATALLYAAIKYAVIGLEKKCKKFLEKNLTVENACVIYEALHLFDEKELCEKALTLIKSESERSLLSPGFLALSLVLVDHIIEAEDLNADEHVVFTAVNNWAEAECGRRRREATPEAKRSVLENTLLKIRFPLMKLRFLAENVKNTELLTHTERLMIHDFIISPTSSIEPFNCNQRKSNQPTFKESISKPRFHSINDDERFPWQNWNVGAKTDAISFKCNKKIIIFGYQLYSQYRDAGKAQYRVTSYFGSEDTVLNTAVQKDEVYIAEGEVFDVIFPHPVSVTAGEWYTLAVLMVGPNTWRGIDGSSYILCKSGVRLDFKESSKSINGTTVEEGQIPALIYSIV